LVLIEAFQDLSGRCLEFGKIALQGGSQDGMGDIEIAMGEPIALRPRICPASFEPCA